MDFPHIYLEGKAFLLIVQEIGIYRKINGKNDYAGDGKGSNADDHNAAGNNSSSTDWLEQVEIQDLLLPIRIMMLHGQAGRLEEKFSASGVKWSPE